MPHDDALIAAVDTQRPAPSQQPDGHEVALHTQLPPWHTCPAAHAAPLPHPHAPPWQVSAVEGHAAHAAPPVPHWLAVRLVTHTPAEQQPVGQLVASHTHEPSLRQCCPAGHTAPLPQAHAPAGEHALALTASHATQPWPAGPHEPTPGVMQVSPLQHPAQLVASQVHTPPRQR
jgi:hypothetical protein